MSALMRRFGRISPTDPRPCPSLGSGLSVFTGTGMLLEWARWSEGFAGTGCESCAAVGSIGGEEGSSRGEDSSAGSRVDETCD